MKQDSVDLDCCRIAFYGLLLFLFSSTRWDIYPQFDPALYHGWLLAPGPWLPGLYRCWLLTLVTSCLGLATRVSTLLAFLLGVYLLSMDWCFGNHHHSHHLIALCLAALAGARCGQRYSLDARLWKVKPSDEYWAVRLCQSLWCLVFFNAGIAKLRHSGLRFASGYNFQLILLWNQSAYGGTPDWSRSLLLEHSWLAGALASAGLLLEVAAPLAFFLKGWPRYLIVAGLAGLQLGASQLMFLNDFVKMSACYVFWIPWSKILARCLRKASP